MRTNDSMRVDVDRATINDIKRGTNIVDLIGKSLQLRRLGSEYVALCPFHHERTPSFTVSQDKQFFHCFGCGKHGDVIDWMVEYHGMRWIEAAAHLASRLGINLVDADEMRRVNAKNAVYTKLHAAAEWLHERLLNTPKALAYLHSRGVSEDTTRDFLIGYAPPVLQDYLARFRSDDEIDALVRAGILSRTDSNRLHPKMGGRIIIPIRDATDRIIAFAGRTTLNVQPKYLNSPDSAHFSKRHELFRTPSLRQAVRRAGRIVIVEGYFDAVALYDAGIRNVAACMGTALSVDVIESALRLSSHVVICLDGDRAGRVAAWKALLAAMPLVGNGRLVSFAFLPDGMDPDDFVRQHGADAFVELIDAAKPMSDFFISAYANKRSASPPETHSSIMQQAARQAATANDRMLRDTLITRLAETFSVTPDQVRRAAGIGRTQNKPAPAPDIVINLEAVFLASLLRHPERVHDLPPDVKLNLPGGDAIVSMLRHGGGTDVRSTFANSPYATLVENLLRDDALIDDPAVACLRVELNWVSARVKEEMSRASIDHATVRTLLARRTQVQSRLDRVLQDISALERRRDAA